MQQQCRSLSNLFVLQQIKEMTTEVMKQALDSFRKRENYKAVVAFAQEQLKAFYDSFLFSVPETVLRDITPAAIVQIDELICKNALCAAQVGNVNYMELCVSLMRAVLFPCIFELDFKNVKHRNSKKGIVYHLQYVPDIKILSVPDDCCDIPTLAVNIKYLKQLQCFEFKKLCNDSIIRRIGENCPDMKALSVAHSIKVTDQSVPHLLKLKNLRYFDGYLTSISKEGYKIILTEIKTIENIFSLKDHIEEILTDIDEEILKNKDTFAGKVRNPQILVERCPNLKELSILAGGVDLTQISNFASIEKLQLSNLSFVECNVKNLFPNLGIHLQLLSLERVDDLNICQILEYCIRLVHLSIKYCKFTHDEIQTSPNMPHFKSLTSLLLVSNSGHKWYINNLKYYESLQLLYANMIDGIDDDFIESTTDSGLKNLVAVRLKRCETSIATAYILIGKCPNIKVIGDLKDWSAVTQLDYVHLKETINADKLKIKLILSFAD